MRVKIENKKIILFFDKIFDLKRNNPARPTKIKTEHLLCHHLPRRGSVSTDICCVSMIDEVRMVVGLNKIDEAWQ